MRDFNFFTLANSIHYIMFVLSFTLSTFTISPSISFASPADRAIETLNQIAEAGKTASDTFELDAEFEYQDPSCLPLGDANSFCTAMNVYGIGVNLLLQDQALMMLQLVISPANVRDEKSIGKAINAFVAFSVDPKKQDVFDFYALAFAACVLRKTEGEKVLKVDPFKLTSTGSGCVAEFEP